jgi:hypothetical protein
MNRADRRRQAREDERLLVNGIDPEDMRNPEPTAAMARQLSGLFDRAKRDGSIDEPVRFLHSKVDATLRRLKDVPVAMRERLLALLPYLGKRHRTGSSLYRKGAAP